VRFSSEGMSSQAFAALLALGDTSQLLGVMFLLLLAPATQVLRVVLL